MKLFISPTLESKQIAQERLKNNKVVYDYGLGENKLPAPSKLISSISNNLEKKEYVSANGIDKLNELIKKRYSSDTYIIKNVLFGNGLKEMLYLIQKAFDGIIFHITPSWVSYEEQINILFKYNNLKPIPTKFINNYKLTPNDLETELKKYKNHKKIILFNNPCNPTGILYTKSEVEKLASVLKKYNCIVMADEIYHNLCYKNDFFSISEFIPELTIIGDSISKDMGCGGYRLGWLTFPEKQKELYDICSYFASSIYSCPCVPIQHGLADYLENSNKDYIQYIQNSRNIFKNVASLICTKLKNSDLQFIYPNAAWYVFISFDKYIHKLLKLNINNSIELGKYLLNNLGIVTVAGNHFNYDCFSLRFSFANLDINKLPDIKLAANKLLEGIDVLIEFLNSL